MAQVQKSDSSTKEASGGTGFDQFLTFQLSGEVYGVNILDIKEIIEYDELTTVPMMPDFIAGVINLRGSVVPIINLSSRFGVEKLSITKRTSFVIIEMKVDDETTMEVGVIVDTVNEVLDISPGEIEPSPSFGTHIRADFIAGMAKVKEKFLILLDVNHVLSIEELSAVDGLQTATTQKAVS